jgi:Ca2+-binding RTX toxin-like protein
MTDARRLFDNAELALAAYAKLQNGITSAGPNLDALRAVSDVGVSPTQADEFASRHPTIVTQFDDTADEGGMSTGFSATVFKGVAGNLELAIRGTDNLFGSAGDVKTDADIFMAGAGYDQIVAMVNWWLRISSSTNELVRQFRLVEVSVFAIPANAVMLRSNADSAYILDVGAEVYGTGQIAKGTIVDVTGHSLGGHLAMAFSTLFAGNTSRVTVFDAPGFIDNAANRAFFLKLGGSVPTGNAIVNVIADEALVGQQLFKAVAGWNSRPGDPVDIPVENQWNSDEPAPFQARNHSVTLLADSLAVYKLLTDLSPSLTTADYKTILNQATQGTAAGYERIVDSINRLFRVPGEALPFGNDNRETLYDALYKLWNRDEFKNEAGKLQIRPVDYRVLLLGATSNDAQAIAYRYALVKGDHLVVTGNAAIFDTHNTNGELDLYDSVTGRGALTSRWLEDRSSFLQRKLDIAARNEISDIEKPIPLAVETKTWLSDDAYFEDRTTNYRINQGGQRLSDAHVVFGSDRSDAISGSSRDDRLYGAGGTDYLRGQAGNDYIEGGTGLDVYEYGRRGRSSSAVNDGADTILDVDGLGVLRYTYQDSVGVQQSTVLAEASIKLSDTRWQSADGKAVFEKGNGGLVITIAGLDSGSITINNFRDGDYGIRLWQSANASLTTFTIAGDQAPKDFDAPPEMQTQTDELGNIIVDPATPEPDRADTLNDSGANDLITSLGGNDVITASRGGDDSISAGAGRDWVDAGYGNDFIEGGSGGSYADQVGGDALHGGAGDDWIYGDTEITLPDAIRNGNAGTRVAEIGDFVSGGAGDDRIIAGSADDLLSGGSGKDLIVAGAGNDDIWGDREQAAGLGWTAVRTAQKDNLQPSFKSEYTGVATSSDGSDGDADVIYGGAGADWISGEAGNDFIDGGPDIDVLYGMDGMDILIGADGDDWITGDFAVPQPGRADAADYLDGGAGDDHLYGNGGDDVLIGGPGNDILLGGDGKDIYVFAKGDGEDTIFDAPTGANDPNSSIVVLGDGISPSNVKFRKGSLVVDLGSQDPGNPTSPRDALHFEGFDALNPYSTPVIGELRFYDGTSMTYDEILAQGFDIDGTTGDDNGIAASKLEGTAVADRIHGYEGHDVLMGLDGNDMLDGGPGNDRLDGGAGDDYLDGGAGIDDLSGGVGNDTYVFDPLDSITDAVGSNTVTFGVGISPEDLRISQITVFGLPRLLLTQTGVTGAGMVLQNTSITQQKFSYSFSDGSTLTQEQLAEIAYTTPQDLSGTSGDDVMVGYAGDDSLSGGSGNDRLSGGGGNDILDGGAGDDVVDGGIGDDRVTGGAGSDVLHGGAGRDSVYGGNGADTYRFGTGDGTDILTDGGNDGAADRILLDEGIQASDVMLRREASGDLTLTLSRDDILTVSGWYTRPENRVERIVFADGTVIDENALAALTVLPIAGTEGPDNIIGTIYADSLIGFAGDDYLDGGKADDVLSGGSGTDTYALHWGGGKDTVIELPREASTILLSPAMGFQDIDAQRTENDLLVYVRRANDGLLLKNYFGQEHDWQVKTSTGEVRPLTEILSSPRSSTGSPVLDLWEEWKTAEKAAWYGNRPGQLLADGQVYRVGTDARLTANATYINGDLMSSRGDVTLPSATYESVAFNSAASDAANQYWSRGNTLTMTTTRATFKIGWNTPQVYSTSRYIGSAFGSDGVLHQYYQTNISASYSGSVSSILPGVVSGIRAEDVSRLVTGTNGNGELAPPPQTINGDFYTVTTRATGIELHAGPSNNVIGSRTFGLIDGGAGNDLIDDQAGGDAIGDMLYGGPGNDRITGSGNADLIIGGPGDDRLAGWSGNDTYFIMPDDVGVDLINEVTWYLWDTYDGRGLYNADSGFRSADTVEFGSGVGLDDVRLSWGSVAASYAWWSPVPTKIYDTLDISLGSTETVRVMLPDHNDPVVVRQMAESPGESWGIEYFRFADSPPITADDLMQRAPARSLVGTDGDDALFGRPGTDIFAGGRGDDWLVGDAGNDIYQFNAGDGVDVIEDTKGNDTLVFGRGISPSDISLGLGSMMLRVGNGGDTVHIEGFDPSNAAASAVIETFQFADGTQLTHRQLLERGFDLYGTDGQDFIEGTSAVDRIYGFGGDDTLNGGAADDTLDGGAGADLLRGGAGSDRYILASGFGNDRIEDADPSGHDVDIVMIDGSAADFTAHGADGLLTLTTNDAADRLTIVWDADAGYGVERISFTDGTVWDASALQAFFPPANSAPVAGDMVNAQPATEDSPYTYTLPASTFFDPDPDDRLTFTATLVDGRPLPQWLTLNPQTARFAGTPSNADVGAVRLSVTAMDQGGLSAATDVSIQVVNVNDGPMLSHPIGDQRVDEDAVFDFTVPDETFYDIDANDVLLYSAKREDGQALPDWLQFQSDQMKFRGTPTNADVGDIGIQLVATDLAGAVGQAAFTLTVVNTNDAPDAADDLAVAVEDGGAVVIHAASLLANDVDIDLNDHQTVMAVTSSQSGVPVMLSGNDVLYDIGDRFQDLGAGAVWADQFTYTMADDAGATSGASVHVTVVGVNDVPVVGQSLSDQDGNQNAPIQFTISEAAFIDVDANDSLAWSATLEGGGELPDWLRFDPVTRHFDGAPREWDVGETNIMVKATDQNGAAVSSTFTVAVSDAATVNAAYTGTTRRDVIKTGFSNDAVDAGKGDDTVYAGAGRDLVLGGDGDDHIWGEFGKDALYGGNGNDHIDGGADDDRLYGGAGHDALSGGMGNDLLAGGAGHDTITTGHGRNIAIGGQGNDDITGGADRDVFLLNPGDGNDALYLSQAELPENADVLSVGGRITPADVYLRRDKSDLLVELRPIRSGKDEAERVTAALKDWYVDGGSHRTIHVLQLFEGGEAVTYDFLKLVMQFDAATRGRNETAPWRAQDTLRSVEVARGSAIAEGIADVYAEIGVVPGDASDSDEVSTEHDALPDFQPAHPGTGGHTEHLRPSEERDRSHHDAAPQVGTREQQLIVEWCAELQAQFCREVSQLDESASGKEARVVNDDRRAIAAEWQRIRRWSYASTIDGSSAASVCEQYPMYFHAADSDISDMPLATVGLRHPAGNDVQTLKGLKEGYALLS